MGPAIFIRRLEQEETAKARDFVWKVFKEYEAPDYTEAGMREFYKSIHDETYLSKLCLYGAFTQKQLMGSSPQEAGERISLYFL